MAKKEKVNIEKVEDFPIDEMEGFYHDFEIEQSEKKEGVSSMSVPKCVRGIFL